MLLFSFLIFILFYSFFLYFFFFFNDTATTEIYTLSLHDALPICPEACWRRGYPGATHPSNRSEEHTSELQSQSNLVCRLLLEKKKKIKNKEQKKKKKKKKKSRKNAKK